MLYRQYIDNDLGFKGADIIYWGPASFRPPSVKVIQGKLGADNKSPVEVLPSTEEQVETNSVDTKPAVTFLSLPLEIRRMIYGYVHNMNPIQYTKLMAPSQVTQISPWFPRMPLNRCVYRRIAPKDPPKETLPSELSLSADPTTPSHKVPLLSPHRPFAGFQSALLRTSKQVYYDSREYPFRENEFVFFTWFSSGFWAARSFVTRLQPWQRDSMQYVRLELMAPDLQGACDAEWEELCGFWARGLRGLRLKILGVVSAARASNVVSKVVGNQQRTVQIRDPEDGRVMPWVERGLKRMANLEHLEVELLIPGWDDQKKLEWCRSLDEALNDPKDNREKYVDVISVERA
ncbi:hypothetical protein SLS62_007925 [Diatrype stigma]|uniref:Uncharacterized protein n=1 Tax=Diatrype stigma TaxID=117547 RepID=A0AAN9UKT4_9PEZI